MAILYNGDCYFQTTSPANIPLCQGAKSIIGRFNFSATTNTQSILNMVNPTLGIGFQFGIAGGFLRVWSYGGGVLVQCVPPTINVWHSFAYTYNGTTHTLYLDGISKATDVVATQVGVVNTIQIGGNQWSEYPRNAMYENLRCYNKCLSDNEVMTFHQCTMSNILTDGLICNWPCQEGLSKSMIASDLVEIYGNTHSLLGVAPFPISFANYFIGGATPLSFAG